MKTRNEQLLAALEALPDETRDQVEALLMGMVLMATASGKPEKVA